MTQEKTPDEEHPAYGMISFNRMTLGGSKRGHRFFGSDLDDHFSAVRLRIGHGARVRGTGHDWYRATDKIIEVDLTGSQFADLLTLMNVGDGVPCTIRYANGVTPPELPRVETSADRSRNDLKNTTKEITANAKALIAKMESVFGGSAVNKKDRTELLHDLKMVVQEIEASIPFALTTFQEAVNTTISQAKSEIASFAATTVQKAAASLPAADVEIIETRELLPRSSEQG